MQENQESKFTCKLCNKKYPCGKSLGGHMRSHVIAENAGESEEKAELNTKEMSSLPNEGANFSKKEAKIDEFGGQGSQGSYGLRENPKKTWRAVGHNLYFPPEKTCKQCGKKFQSLKALCGHMACHSEKEKGGGNKDDNSWTCENPRLVLDSHSDTEAEEGRRLISESRSSKRYKKITVKPSSYSSAKNNVSENDETQQGELAMSLMMLSTRDPISKGGGLNSVVESSDNNSVILGTKSLYSTEMRADKREGLVMEIEAEIKLEKNDSSEMVPGENSDSGYFLGDANVGESEVSADQTRRNAAYWECANSTKCLKVKGYRTESRKESTKHNGFGNGGTGLNKESKNRKKTDNIWYEEEDDDELVAESYKRLKHGSSENAAKVSNTPCKRNKYECLNCKKSFKSYQALGGHRPCHKRINAYSESTFEHCESRLDASNVGDQKPFGHKKGRSEKKINKSKKQKSHVCPFCQRVFKSGQAFGGHKRSHFLGRGGNEEIRNHRSPEINKPKVHGLFDLNLPAPGEDEDDNGNIQFPHGS